MLYTSAKKHKFIWRECVISAPPTAREDHVHLPPSIQRVCAWIPDPDWAGNAVLDFEEWTTVWELNYGGGDWHSIRYPEYSLKLEEEEHPDWNLTQIYLQAKKDFNTSAVAFFAESLKTLTGLRPKV